MKGELLEKEPNINPRDPPPGPGFASFELCDQVQSLSFSSLTNIKM